MSRRVPAFVTKHANLERMWNFGMFVMERIDKASLKQVASSLTLTTLLSIVPALAVIMAAFSAFPLFAPYREAFEQFIFSTLLPEQYSDQILGYIKQFATQAAGLTAFGLIGLMVSALLCIATIDSALNSTYEVLKLRSLWQRVLMYWALLTLGPVAIGISLAASSYLTGMAMSGHLSVYAQWLIPIGQLIFQSIILAHLYKYVQTPGSLDDTHSSGGSDCLSFYCLPMGLRHLCHARFLHDDIRCLCRDSGYADMDVHKLDVCSGRCGYYSNAADAARQTL